MRSMRISLPVYLLATVVPAQATTWVVDVQGGPGAHFTDLPPAVAAAADGDTISIRTGSYSSFTTGKALTVLGEGGVRVGSLLPAPPFLPPNPPSIEVTGLPAGKTFVLANLDVDFADGSSGVALRQNAGRIHVENVRSTLFTFPAQTGVACLVWACTEVTWTGGALHGKPAVSANGSAVAFSSVDIRGDAACGAAACGLGYGASVAMVASGSQIWLSRADVEGGDGSLFPLPAVVNPAPAILMFDGALVATGDSATRIAAGAALSSIAAPTPAILTGGGSVDLDTLITVEAAPGAAEVEGAATVVRRRIVSLSGRGGPPGGTLHVEVVSPSGDLINLVASVPADPLPLPVGTVFLSPLVILPLVAGTQGARGVTAVDIGVPNVAALRGGTVAMQAANFYQSTGLVEFSNPLVAILH